MKKNLLFPIVFWTFFVFSISMIILYDSKEHYFSDMQEIAKLIYKKELADRNWIAEQGGVYVPITEKIQPNPYLSYYPNRDIMTKDSIKLTLINPAYKTRLVYDQDKDLLNHTIHLSSLNPLNPSNKADEWERKILQKFEKERNFELEAEFIDTENGRVFRTMIPFIVDENCMKCHKHQGYKIGDIRGGLSVSLNEEKILEADRQEFMNIIMILILFWFVGLVIIFFYVKKTNYLFSALSNSKANELSEKDKLLLESERRFQLAIESSKLGLWEWDLVTNTIFLSSTWSQIFGFDNSGSEMEKFDEWMKKVHKDDEKVIQEELEKHFSGEKDFAAVEHRYLFDDNIYRWVLQRGKVSEYDESGKPIKMIGTTYDIHEQKNIYLKLEKREFELTQTQEVAKLGSWDLNLVTQKLNWSREAFKLFEKDPDTYIPTFDKFAKLVHPDDFEFMQTNFNKALESDESPYHVNVTIINHTGFQWIMEAYGKVVRDEQGNALRIFGTAQNVTEKKINEINLQKNLDQLNYSERTSKTGSWEWDLRTNKILWSDGLCILHGLKPGNFDGKFETVISMIHPDDKDLVNNESTTMIKTKKTKQFDYRIITKSGEIKNVTGDQTMEFDSKGEIVKMNGILRDITEKKINDNKLQKSLDQLNYSERTSKIGSWEWKVKTGQLNWSDGMCILHGLKPGKFDGKFETGIGFCHPDDIERINKEIKDTLETKISNTFSYRIITNDGEEKIIAGDHTVELDLEGELVRMFGIARDVTEKKINDDKLQKSLGQLNYSERTSKIGSWEWNVKTRQVNWSDGMCILHGLKPGKFDGKIETSLGFCHPDDIERITRESNESLKTKIPSSCIYRIITNEGEEKIVSGEHTVELDSKGKLEKLNGIVRDITEEIKLKDELSKTNDMLLHAGKLSAIGSLSASIAHEFNNPIQGILNTLNGVSRRNELDEDEQELLSAATDECLRMKDMIRSLQDFNKPSSARETQIDIHQSINSLLILGKKDYSKREIRIKKEYSKELPSIMAVSDQIKQVFLNILNNAVDAINTKGVITIRTKSLDDKILIEFCDTGSGISKENIDKLFEPFFTTKPDLKGTGLGLSVSHGIIKKHGGDIEIESELDKGSTFKIYLPKQDKG